jgi:lipoprotein-anchoring transpeptidase ErfK/SrfK
MVRLNPMSSHRPLFAAALLAGATLLAGCALPNAGQATPTAAPATVVAPPEITVNPVDRASGVPLDAAVLVTSTAGNLTSVVVTRAGSNAPVAGQLSSNRRTWKATDGLDPAAQYTVSVAASGAGGSHTTAQSTFSTIPSANRLLTTVTPGDGSTVGVGQTINLRFNNDIPPAQQPDIVRHLEVVSSPPQTGAWHWFTPREIHYRPEVYWTSGTKVTLNANLHGVNAGNNTWGLASFTQGFTVGDKHVSLIDNNTLQMQVFNNDKLLYTWPVSMGKAGFPTLEGTLTVLYKTSVVNMNSCGTFGGAACVPGSTNYYNEKVYWDTAISTNGFFVHAAPWSVGQQGRVDVSHGCVNLSTDRAITFYNFSRTGDVVVISHTGNTADWSNGEADWQIPFAQFDNTGVAAPAEPASPSGLPGGA